MTEKNITRDGETVQSLRAWAKKKKAIRSFSMEYTPDLGPYVWTVKVTENEIETTGVGNNLRDAAERALESLAYELEQAVTV